MPVDHGGRMKSTLSCVAEPLDRLDHVFRIAAVVVFDDFDLHLLAADIDAAGVVHVLHPDLIVRQRRHGGAGRERSGLGDRPADLQRFLRLRRRTQRRRHGQRRKRGNPIKCHCSLLPGSFPPGWMIASAHQSLHGLTPCRTAGVHARRRYPPSGVLHGLFQSALFSNRFMPLYIQVFRKRAAMLTTNDKLRDFLVELFRTAVATAHPAQCLPTLLPPMPAGEAHPAGRRQGRRRHDRSRGSPLSQGLRR